jgi:chromosome partitioning protein
MGSSGKSTITAALAVQAAKDGGRVALLDWEPQSSLTLWWVMRGKPDNPRLIREDEPAAAMRRLAGERDWLLLDTAPAMMDQVELAIQAADFVLIPVWHRHLNSSPTGSPIVCYPRHFVDSVENDNQPACR